MYDSTADEQKLAKGDDKGKKQPKKIVFVLCFFYVALTLFIIDTSGSSYQQRYTEAEISSLLWVTPWLFNLVRSFILSRGFFWPSQASRGLKEGEMVHCQFVCMVMFLN